MSHKEYIKHFKQFLRDNGIASEYHVYNYINGIKSVDSRLNNTDYHFFIKRFSIPRGLNSIDGYINRLKEATFWTRMDTKWINYCQTNLNNSLCVES